MKKIKYALVFILVFGVIFSCDKFLDNEPPATLTVDNFYQIDKDLEQASAGIYGSLAQRDDGYRRSRVQFLLEFRGDAMMHGRFKQADVDRREVATYQYSPSNGVITTVWEFFYNGINNANLLIEKGPIASGATAAVKKRTVAEAYFFRGFFYFQLVRLWGDVPLYKKSATTFAEITIPRTPASEVYAQIIDDLKRAAGELDPSVALPDQGDNGGRVAKSAAYATLADVYLTLKNYSESARYAKLIIDGGRHALWSDYDDAFSLGLQYEANTAPNAESVFSIKYNPDIDPGGEFPNHSWPAGLRFPYSNSFIQGEGTFEVDSTTYNRINPADKRRDFNFPRTYLFGSGKDRDEGGTAKMDTIIREGAYAGKYINRQGPSYFNLKYNYDDSSLRWWTGSAPWPIYRYSDVLLMYLEAINEQGAASQGILDETINKTRARGGLAPLTTGLGQAGIRQAIKDERLIEFMFEAKRFYDLVRWGDLVSAVNNRKFGYANARTIDERYKLLPIPQREMDSNPNMGQNNPPWN